jgi:hypothetical protein
VGPAGDPQARRRGTPPGLCVYVVSSGRLLAEYRQLRKLEQPAYTRPVDTRVLERCAYCSFEIRAPLKEAREAFKAHRCGAGFPRVL